MIEMNRISRLLHKQSLLPRQRKAVDYSHRYVIGDKDLQNSNETMANSKAVIDPVAEAEKLIDGFNPDKDAWDRRILYEVTGISLRYNEFAQSDSESSSDDEGGVEIDADEN